MRNEKLIYGILVVVILLAIGVALFVLNKSSVVKIKDLDPDREIGQTVKLVGIIKTGAQLATVCPDYFYIEDNSGYIQVRSKHPEYEGYSDIKLDEKYLGKKVEIVGTYQFSFCQAICMCDPHILVETIKIIE